MPSNTRNSIAYSRTIHKFNTATLDKQPDNQQLLSSQPLSLTLSYPHDNQTTITILPLNTISLRQQTFDCQSATKFPANTLFPLQTPFFWCGVAHRNCTTPLALERFLCGYEACHLSTTKVQSPQSALNNSPSRNARHSTLQTVFLLYQQLQPTTIKSPCCPTLKAARH